MGDKGDIPNEEWRPVDGFPYEVSRGGRVRRVAGGSNNAKPGRILKGYVDRDGYVVVRLSREGVAHDRKVHRLVCEAFHGASSLPEVRHRDGNRSNNQASNLSWGTAAQNAADREGHGNTLRGERSPRAKLTQAQVAEIRSAHQRAKEGRQRVPRGWVQETAVKFGITVNGLNTILSGRGYAS